MKCKLAEGQGQQADDHGKAQGQQQPLHQHLAQRCAVAAAGSLGRKTGRAHAQKAHQADHEGEQGGAHRHCAQLMGMGQVANDGAVDQRHQRYRDIGEDHRCGQAPDLAVGRAVAPVGGEGAHRCPRAMGQRLQAIVYRPGNQCARTRSHLALDLG
ncbi:hypothetical protein D3C80_1308690 [compost metagenome]